MQVLDIQPVRELHRRSQKTLFLSSTSSCKQSLTVTLTKFYGVVYSAQRHMPFAARALLIYPAHFPTICKKAAKPCICHTSKNALPQVLCLPHLRIPPGVPVPFSSNLERILVAFRTQFLPTSPSALGSMHLPQRCVQGFVGFHRSPATNHESRLFKFFSAYEGFYSPVARHGENRLCYTGLGFGKHSS
jgi:hypothetical protein